jgi:hypothetical protein
VLGGLDAHQVCLAANLLKPLLTVDDPLTPLLRVLAEEGQESSAESADYSDGGANHSS